MKLLAMCAIMASAAAAAQAQTISIYQTGFEPGEGFFTGNLNGQNGWSTFLGESPNFGEVTSVNPLAGLQSILLDGQQVELGSFNNYAAIGHSAPIAPTLKGVPLRYIEVTGLCSIVDPTLDPNHHSNFWFAQYQIDDQVTLVGTGSRNGHLVFGHPTVGCTAVVIVQAGVPFQFRHLVDYVTGTASAWINDQLVYQDFTDGFFPAYVTSDVYFEGQSVDLLPFDTQVWYDDIHVKAIYCLSASDIGCDGIVGPADLAELLAQWGACPAKGECAADLDSDGTVGPADLAQLLAGWSG